MINNNEFALRLKKVLEFYQLSASAFADKIKVQRSSISHLLSGRNKPSLDFVLKVLHEFNEVELYWLLNGKGSFPVKNTKIDSPTTLFDSNTDSQQETNKKGIAESIIKNNSLGTKQIERIIIFYTDGSFSDYSN